MSNDSESQEPKRQRSNDDPEPDTNMDGQEARTANDERFSDVDTSEDALYGSTPSPEDNPPNEEEDVDMQDDATVVAGSTPAEIFKTRVTLTLSVKCRSNPRAATTQLLRSFFQAAKQHDDHFGFIPWYQKDASTKPILLTAEQIPAVFSQIQGYSPRLNPDKKKLQQTIWASLYLQHSDSWIETVRNVAHP